MQSAAPNPGIDFRSVFTIGGSSSAVFARGYANQTIYEQTSFANFVPFLTLTGATIDSQAQVVYDAALNEYLANSNGTLQAFDAAGVFVSSTTLQGFNSSYPQGRNLAADGSAVLTYDSGAVSAYDPATGALLGTAALVGGGADFNSNLSFSYTNGFALISDGNTVQGYALAAQPAGAPAPLAGAGLLSFFGAGGLAMRKRVKRVLGSLVNRNVVTA